MLIRMNKVNDLVSPNQPMGAVVKDPSGFVENFEKSFNVMFKQETFHSPWHYREMYDAREDLIDDMEKDGRLPTDISKRLGNDYSAKAQWLKEFGGQDIDTDEDLAKQRAKLAQADREALAETADRSNFWGKAGVFMGSIAGATLDFDAIVYPFAGYKLIGTSAKIIPTMAKTALLTSGVESAKQMVVQNNAYKLKQPKEAKEILQNIGYAAAGDMILSGVGAGVRSFSSKKVASQLRKIEPDLDPIAKSQVHNSIREMDAGVSEDAVEVIERVEARAQEYEKPQFIRRPVEPIVQQRLAKTLEKTKGELDQKIKAADLLDNDIQNLQRELEKIDQRIEKKRSARKEVRRLKRQLGETRNKKKAKALRKKIKKLKRVKRIETLGTTQKQRLKELEQKRAVLSNESIPRSEASVKKIAGQLKDLTKQEELRKIAKPLKKEPSVTTHPKEKDSLAFLTKENREWIENQKAEIIDRADIDELSSWTECAIKNGVIL